MKPIVEAHAGFRIFPARGANPAADCSNQRSDESVCCSTESLTSDGKSLP